jgi:hypothetical protein
MKQNLTPELGRAALRSLLSALKVMRLSARPVCPFYPASSDSGQHTP